MQPNSALQTVQFLVAPVVMISANGLFSLALYNRLAAIVSRARVFHKEHFDALRNLSAAPPETCDGQGTRQLQKRVTALEYQSRRVLRRARLVRDALIYLLASVLCMLSCSLALGLSTVVANLDALVLLLFCLGVLSMMVAAALAIAELAASLEPVTAEAVSLEHEDAAAL
jgi:hypothetical protein